MRVEPYPLNVDGGFWYRSLNYISWRNKALLKISFSELNDRLILAAKERIRNGGLTERGLARSIGISQPHLHNILKGVRTLSCETADRLLSGLQLSVLDLLSKEERAQLASL